MKAESELYALFPCLRVPGQSIWNLLYVDGTVIVVDPNTGKGKE